MSTSTIVWIVIGVIVLLALVAVAVKIGGRKKLDRRRVHADEIRHRAGSEEGTVRKQEAEAAEQEAHARQARAEADRKAAEAEKLQIDAQESAEQASGKRAEHHDRLRTADDIDPDVEDGASRVGNSDGSADRRDAGSGPDIAGRP